MTNKTKLTPDMIPQICEMVKLRMKWNQIAYRIGVTVQTLKNWRNWGLEARAAKKRNIHVELVDAIDAARTEMIKEPLAK